LALVISLFWLGSASLASAASTLTLNGYLDQVRRTNDNYRASADIGEGAMSRSKEGDLITTPTAFASASLLNDKSPKPNPLFQGTQTIANNYQIGVSQQTRFGLLGRLYYNVTYTSIKGVDSAFINPSTYYDTRPVLELTMPLWRNFLGSETNASIDALEASALATSYGQRFNAKTVLAQAESAYWRLELAREALAVTKSAYERAEKIRDWSRNRSKLNLGDESDLLQAEAVLKLRGLELQGALDEERSATLAFNSARGVDVAKSTQAPEQLESISDLVDQNAVKASPVESRDDVRAVEYAQKANEALAKEGQSRMHPTFEIFTTLTVNGHDKDYTPAQSNALSSKFPANTFGARFSVPLDLGLASDVRAGYAREAIASEERTQRKKFESQIEWQDLSKRLEEAKKRYQLAREVESVQKEKMLNEKRRKERGRTTTYFVLQFEQDYAVAQLARLRSAADIMNLVAQMRVYGDEKAVQ
jgi:outer membrane protein TolC